MKKILSLVLAVVMIMAMAIPAFAAQPEVVEPQACNHDNMPSWWGPATTSTIWEVFSDSTCKKTVIVTKVCTRCGETDRDTTVTYPYHGTAVNKATCDGTTQTLIYTCPKCGAYRYTDWQDCPGAGRSHQNGCQWLPA